MIVLKYRTTVSTTTDLCSTLEDARRSQILLTPVPSATESLTAQSNIFLETLRVMIRNVLQEELDRLYQLPSPTGYSTDPSSDTHFLIQCEVAARMAISPVGLLHETSTSQPPCSFPVTVTPVSTAMCGGKSFPRCQPFPSYIWNIRRHISRFCRRRQWELRYDGRREWSPHVPPYQDQH